MATYGQNIRDIHAHIGAIQLSMGADTRNEIFARRVGNVVHTLNSVGKALVIVVSHVNWRMIQHPKQRETPVHQENHNANPNGGS